MQQQIREYYRNALKYRSIRIFRIEYLDMSINGNVSKKTRVLSSTVLLFLQRTHDVSKLVVQVVAY